MILVGTYGYLYQYYNSLIYTDYCMMIDYSKISSAWFLFQGCGIVIFVIKFLDLKASMKIQDYIKLKWSIVKKEKDVK